MHKKSSQYLLFCLVATFLSSIIGCNHNPDERKSIKFRIKSEVPLLNQNIYLTGNNDKLGNWSPGAVEMSKQPDSTWTKTISFNQGETVRFKITKGSWNTEAVNEDGWLYPDFTFTVNIDTAIELTIPNWKDNLYERRIKKEYFTGKDPELYLINNWKYHTGDNPNWAKENVNDSSWETVTSDLSSENMPKSGWENVGWFRTHFKVDSSLWNKSFAFLIGQLGASEVYLNGKLFYRLGNIGNSQKDYVPEQNRNWREFRFDSKLHQVIAVRYANYSADYLNKIQISPGFDIYIANLNFTLKNERELIRKYTLNEMFFTLIPLILFFVHLLLFSFYRKQKQNLFYAFCLLGFAGLTFFKFERLIISNPGTIIIYYMMNTVSAAVTIFFGTLTAFAISHLKIPRYWWWFLFLGLAVIAVGIIQPVSRMVGIIVYVYFGISMIAIIISAFKSNQQKQKGTWIIFTGFVILSFFIIYQILLDFSVVNPPFNIGSVFVYGMLALAISMSVFLSYNFAYVNKDLEQQLEKVKIYSQKALEQERIASQAEIERRIIEVENERKTWELEEARELQLSLLPKKIPDYENFDISCFMKTATEVGGDYYDVLPEHNESLILTIGDATGHGVKAGTMVAVIKGLFQEIKKSASLKESLERIHTTIRSLQFHNLYMGLSLVKLEKNLVTISSAGMPPVLIYRSETRSVEELKIKHLPLGAPGNFNFEEFKIIPGKGDIILLLTDGLPELFNVNKELLGYEKIKEVLVLNSGKNPGDIIKSLINEASEWQSGSPQNDDITIIAIKVY
jgi:serine phosphatase RsbU (regulator of sigma subunit)